jgi:AcrR family transcriptional regulator
MPRLTPENKELHTARMRENICRTFAEMFAADGDVSMDNLAEKLGIAKGTIYNYFADKKELTAAVMDMRRKAMTALMAQKLSPDLPPTEQLKLFVTIMWQDFNTYRHLRLEYLRNNPVLHVPHRPPVLDFLKRIIEQGIASGEFRKTDPEEAALFVFCSLLGKFRHFLLKQLEADTEKETEVMLSFLLPALKKN